MDTALRNLEQPFKHRISFAFSCLCFLVVLIAVAPGFVTGFHYSFNIINIITFIFLVFLGVTFLRFKTLLDIPTPVEFKLKHIKTVAESEKAAYVCEMLNIFAQKQSIKRPFIILFDKTQSVAGIYAGVTTSQDNHIFVANKSFFMLPNHIILASIGHELGHILNKDIQFLVNITKFFIWALFGALLHASFLNVMYIQLSYLLLLIPLFVVLNTLGKYLNLYIQRQNEFLADISSVKIMGDAYGMIELLYMAHQGGACEGRKPFRVRYGLNFDTHPHYKDRIDLLRKAQSICDKHT